jgi:uncharacterized protein YaaN involved in tellurite resistance
MRSRSKINKYSYDPREAMEQMEIESGNVNDDDIKEEKRIEKENKKPKVSEKSILNLTKDLINAGNELKAQIEQSRIEREEFKKLLNKEFEEKKKEEIIIKEEIKTEE